MKTNTIAFQCRNPMVLVLDMMSYISNSAACFIFCYRPGVGNYVYTKGRVRKYFEAEGRTSADVQFSTQIQVKSKIKKVITSAQWVARYFKKVRGHNFYIFSSVFFSLELIWSWLRNKKDSKGLRRHAPPEKFWEFTCCNGYCSAFWIIFRQILFKFFDPNSECFAKYDAFCSHISDYACLKRKACR